MAKCKACGQDMLIVNGCECSSINYSDKAYNRIHYGSEKRLGTEEDQKCHDCNVLKGHFHHIGCDTEECPKCGGQLISCRCY